MPKENKFRRKKNLRFFRKKISLSATHYYFELKGAKRFEPLKLKLVEGNEHGTLTKGKKISTVSFLFKIASVLKYLSTVHLLFNILNEKYGFLLSSRKLTD